MTVTTIFVDSREQKPFEFAKKYRGITVKTSRKRLETGDYIPRGHGEPRGGVVVERKGYGDFLACMTKSASLGHFKRQLERLEKWDKRIVVVEGSLSTCQYGVYSARKWSPLTLAIRVAGLQSQFDVPILFAEKRSWAASFALEWMMQSINNLRNGDD
tara:strand:- start:24553 stop:25026 length:474 start_codon:yes stop_codon:yes gene_type:complete